MLASYGLDFVENFGDPNYEKECAAIKSEMLEKNELSGLEAKVAAFEVKQFFEDDDLSLANAGLKPDSYYDTYEAVQLKAATRHNSLDESGLAALLDRMRKKYPAWIENYYEYQAAVDSLVSNSEIEDEGVLGFAENEIRILDQDYDSKYANGIPYNERHKFKLKLKKLAGEKLNSLDEEQRDELVRAAIKNHLAWTPLHDDYLAVLEKLNSEDKFSGTTAEQANYVLVYYLQDESSEQYRDNISDEEYRKRDKQLITQVNQELISYDADQRKKMTLDLSKRFEDWIPSSAELADNAEIGELAEAEAELKEMGADGTFWGSFTAVFGLLDIVWLVLGITTAYSVAFKQGGGLDD